MPRPEETAALDKAVKSAVATVKDSALQGMRESTRPIGVTHERQGRELRQWWRDTLDDELTLAAQHDDFATKRKLQRNPISREWWDEVVDGGKLVAKEEE